MGWRQNMGEEPKNEPLISYLQKEQKTIKNSKKNTFATFATSALSIPKVKTPEIIIKKMSTCLNGKSCHFISCVDDRQVCSKNNQPIFDMTACPAGKWERLEDKPQKKTMACYSCGSQTFWRSKNNQTGRWICSECHPPVKPEDEVEYSQ